jgi:hypothetical protein
MTSIDRARSLLADASPKLRRIRAAFSKSTVVRDALADLVYDRDSSTYRDPAEGFTLSASCSEVRALSAWCEVTKSAIGKRFVSGLLVDLRRGYDKELNEYFTAGSVVFCLSKPQKAQLSRLARELIETKDGRE